MVASKGDRYLEGDVDDGDGEFAGLLVALGDAVGAGVELAAGLGSMPILGGVADWAIDCT